MTAQDCSCSQGGRCQQRSYGARSSRRSRRQSARAVPTAQEASGLAGLAGPIRHEARWRLTLGDDSRPLTDEKRAPLRLEDVKNNCSGRQATVQPTCRGAGISKVGVSRGCPVPCCASCSPQQLGADGAGTMWLRTVDVPEAAA